LTAIPGTPSGTIIEFTLHVTADGGYSWDPTFTLAVANPYFDHNIGNVKFTVTNNGICGFIDDSQIQGSGFHYPITGDQYIYIGSVWAGNNPGYIVNRDYSAENSGDWQAIEGVLGDGTFYSDQDSWARYDDSGMSLPKGLSCSQDGWAWSDAPGEDYVIMRYIFRNEGLFAINGLYFGQFMDWNMGDADSNSGDVDLSRNLIYMYGSGTKYVGIGLLDPSSATNITFIYNPDFVVPNGYILDSHKDWFLKGMLSTQTASPWGDWSVCISSGPFVLYPGDSSVFAIAVLGGEDASDMQVNYDNALARYGSIGIVKEPSIIKDPSAFSISKIYPQPFSSMVTIEYTVPRKCWVSLNVYDVMGRLVRTVANLEQSVGMHSVQWNGKMNDGRAATSGVYFCRLTIEGNEIKKTKKLLIVR
ncbi:T9SS type A sorting domain-containing protein, partial [candidate division WOR-3 bacterium]|nr:T9SS type A sorting domain-containing protein [candidate division WOR-3 bacterium]